MYPTLILKPGREKSVYNYHPWLFSGAVQQLPAPEEAPTGSIVRVMASDGTLAGHGFLDREAQITCRLFCFGDEPEAEGPFEAEYWAGKLEKAMALRKNLLVLNPVSDSCRLVNAEGDFFPGLIIDFYGGQVAVLQLLVKGTEAICAHIVAGLAALGIEYVFVKNAHNTGLAYTGSGWLTAPLPAGESIIIQEKGLKFRVNFDKGQKTGFFIDQRENRRALQNLAKGKTVLNAFGYTGGFSVYALKGGATEVTSVDISAEATALCHENVELNKLTAPHEAVTADCFDYIRNAGRTWDVIVLDPPAFAKNAHSVNNAARGYKELNMAAIKALNPGGMLLTFSCSQNISPDLFQKIVFGAAADTGRKVRILGHFGQPADHPVSIYHPEGEYLKGLLLFAE